MKFFNNLAVALLAALTLVGCDSPTGPKPDPTLVFSIYSPVPGFVFGRGLPRWVEARYSGHGELVKVNGLVECAADQKFESSFSIKGDCCSAGRGWHPPDDWPELKDCRLWLAVEGADIKVADGKSGAVVEIGIAEPGAL